MDAWLCEHVVERTTDHIEGVLGAADRAAMAAHLSGCPGCAAYLGQVGTTLRLIAELLPEVPSDELETILVARYRERTASVTV
jgi:predicted anti-sigma-YlaC factor YlaD